MPRELYPSSYECDCGHVSHFFENTINEIKRESFKRKVCLADSDNPSHYIYFYKGIMVDIGCPHGAAKSKQKKKSPRARCIHRKRRTQRQV